MKLLWTRLGGKGQRYCLRNSSELFAPELPSYIMCIHDAYSCALVVGDIAEINMRTPRPSCWSVVLLERKHDGMQSKKRTCHVDEYSF